MPGMLPQIRLSTLKDVRPIMPTVRLKENGPEVPLYYTDEKGKRRRIIPDWSFTLIDAK